jgi:hypothetical protein
MRLPRRVDLRLANRAFIVWPTEGAVKGPARYPVWPVYCLALMGAYRARQFVSGKAPFAGNSGALAKSGNAAGRELECSLRASRQEAVRGVAFPQNRLTMPSKMRRAVNLLATR